jgi:hypothetical protein
MRSFIQNTFSQADPDDYNKAHKTEPMSSWSLTDTRFQAHCHACLPILRSLNFSVYWIHWELCCSHRCTNLMILLTVLYWTCLSDRCHCYIDMIWHNMCLSITAVLFRLL